MKRKQVSIGSKDSGFPDILGEAFDKSSEKQDDESVEENEE